MKTKLLTLGLVLASASLFAQGKVAFRNDSTRLFMMGSAVYSPLDAAYANQPIPTTGLPSGDLSALLYAGTTAGSLSLQTSVPLTGTSIMAPGLMAPKNLIMTIPGALNAYFQIFIVNTTAIAPGSIFGGTGGSAFVNTIYFGTSGLFTAFSSNGITYPSIYAPPSTWAAGPVFISAPEPSVFALVGISGAMLTVHRRRR